MKKKQNKLINRYTIGLLISLVISFILEKKISSESFKIIKYIITSFVIYSSYLFAISFFKLNIDKKSKLNIKYLIFKNTTIIKYLPPLGATLLNVYRFKNTNYLYLGLCELILIFLITNLLSRKYKRLSNIFNGISLFLFTVNQCVHLFGSTYLSYIMISNIDSIEMLGNKLFLIVPLSIVVILFAFIPTKPCVDMTNFNLLTYITIFIYFLLIACYTFIYSPILSYGNLLMNIYNNYEINKSIDKYKKEDNLKEFYNSSTSNYIKYDNKLGNKPNVILIFTEGLSKHIIEDERNIMPNTKELMNKSLSFDNYYNHVAATFRGIIGQLYSGYQNNNTDKNSLVSIQSILSKNGYTTRYINTEPNNKMFTDYLENLGFDEFIYHYHERTILTDKEAFDSLYDNAIEMNKKDKPFFITMYTVETHIGFDSSDKKFGDGKDQELNKFYNNDYQFNEFIQKFTNSELYDNTIVIYTTDHGTCVDNEYKNSFNGYSNRQHMFLDEIPLIIYHKGVGAKKLDALGKNSLDLAPTILDYIDIENNDNYFLGDSLFTDTNGKSLFDRYYYTEGILVTRDSGVFIETKLTKVKGIKEKLTKYFAEAVKERK